MSTPAGLGAYKLIAFVATAHRDLARTFYRDTLGLRMVSEDPFALVFDVLGTMLRVSIAKDVSPAQQTVLGWEVPDIVAAANALNAAGVQLEHYPFVQNELGIWTAPDGTKVAWFKDPDGNVLSISQHV